MLSLIVNVIVTILYCVLTIIGIYLVLMLPLFVMSGLKLKFPVKAIENGIVNILFCLGILLSFLHYKTYIEWYQYFKKKVV